MPFHAPNNRIPTDLSVLELENPILCKGGLGEVVDVWQTGAILSADTPAYQPNITPSIPSV